MKILVTLCARGGSKGIPQKNIKKLNDRPLIDYSIKFAKEIQNVFEDVIIELSTDDPEIIDVASQRGLCTDYIRAKDLASDSAGKVDVIRDLLKHSEVKYQCRFDYVLDLDVSSPLRTFKDVKEAFDIMENSPDALTLFSVNKAGKNPYFNMVEQSQNGYFNLCKEKADTSLSRQSAPEVYELNASFYIYNRNYFDMDWKGVITDRSLVYKMEHECFDLDEPLDFEFMEFLISNNKLSFKLI